MRSALRLASLALLCAPLCAVPVLASDVFSLDLGIHGGVAGLKDGNSNPFVGGAQARLHIIWLLAAEGRVSYFTNSYDVSGLGGVDLKNTPVQLSAMLYLLKLPGFGLHILGGGTYNAVRLEGTGNVTGSVNTDKWCAHAGAGVDLWFSKHFGLNVDGRYFFLSVDPGNLPPPTSGSYSGDYWTGTVSLLWKAF